MGVVVAAAAEEDPARPPVAPETATIGATTEDTTEDTTATTIGNTTNPTGAGLLRPTTAVEDTDPGPAHGPTRHGATEEARVTESNRWRGFCAHG